jgi:SpoVK/Ycf46/Vps4 family AAA+-type ATPase
MGETAIKLRQVFEFTNQHLGVYFFDEFDAIGAERSRDNEVGEMRRILNSFLQFLEEESSSSFVLAATNHIGLLDKALFRRFDDVLKYELPEAQEAVNLITNRLAAFKPNFKIEKLPSSSFSGLSHAEIALACDDAIKNAVLNDVNSVEKSVLLQMLVARQRAAGVN